MSELNDSLDKPALLAKAEELQTKIVESGKSESMKEDLATLQRIITRLSPLSQESFLMYEGLVNEITENFNNR